MIETIVRWLKRLGLGGGFVLVLLYITFWAYSLPGHAKVHVTGTEVTRRDVEGANGKVRSNDVRYVMAEDLDGKPRMFRNQDSGWGWPPYFKFNSGDIAAQAQSYSIDHRDEVVLVTYYGFRIRMLSAFPNIVSMKTVPPDYQPIPWAAIVVVFLHVVLVGAGVIWIRDLSRSAED